MANDAFMKPEIPESIARSHEDEHRAGKAGLR
jgi:hypothetical protein